VQQIDRLPSKSSGIKEDEMEDVTKIRDLNFEFHYTGMRFVGPLAECLFGGKKLDILSNEISVNLFIIFW